MTHLADRSLPADTHAECQVLGALLLEREAIVTVAGKLRPEHFYLEKYAWIYEAILACYQRRVPPDLTTVADALRRRDRLEGVGGLAFLGELVDTVVTAVHVEYYAEIVERCALRRRLIETGGSIAALGYDETTEITQALDAAEQALFAVAQQRSQQDVFHVAAVADEYYTAIAAAAHGQPPGTPTGFADLDGITGGWQPANLIILAAPTSHGKTSFALSCAYQIAQAGRDVLMFSLEMSRQELIQRLVALHLRIETQRIRPGSINPDHLPRVLDAIGQISELPLHIEDTPGLDISELRSKARRLHAVVPLSLVVVDYLQLITTSQRSENRQQEVSAVSRSLKALARELRCPVLALSQLRRGVDERARKVPLLSDLRESGSIEQDADMVIFIYREELYDEETDKRGIAELHIAKHRNGPLGVVPLRFEVSTTRFFSVDRSHTQT